MRRLVLLTLTVCFVTLSFAQDSTIQRLNRAANTKVGGNDHFMIQFGSTRWQGKPDSINTGGFSRTFNMYFLFAFPFKTSPKMSAAIGVGLATDHIFFKATRIGIADVGPTLVFDNVSDTTHFDKYKLATSFLEAPIELRFTAKPEDSKHSFKIAVGAKIGTMLSAWVKGKSEVNKAGQALRDFTMKEKSKKYFNTNRLSLTGRVGYGAFSAFVSYAVTPLLQEGVGPTLRPMTIGLTIAGL